MRRAGWEYETELEVHLRLPRSYFRITPRFEIMYRRTPGATADRHPESRALVAALTELWDDLPPRLNKLVAMQHIHLARPVSRAARISDFSRHVMMGAGARLAASSAVTDTSSGAPSRDRTQGLLQV